MKRSGADKRKRAPRRKAARSPRVTERVVKARPTDLVSFSVVVAPAPGVTLDDVRRRLSLKSIRQVRPSPEIRLKVVNQLRSMGFDVFEGSGSVVSARGPVRLFTKIFGGQFVRQTRKRPVADSRKVRTDTSIVLKEGSRLTTGIPDVLLVAVARKPKPAAPSLPPERPGLSLHLPGDIAQVMRASATHRRSVSSGDRASGAGVTVAVLDTGFAQHPYYDEHDHRITRISASDEPSEPDEDDEPHGTFMLAGVLACAPDVHVVAIKYGTDPVVALEEAMSHHPQVISLSWGYDTGTNTEPVSVYGDDLIPLQERILNIVASGVTVVAAAGNGGDINFPASMPEVIAVGGVAVNDDDSLEAWDGASSFQSLIFDDRRVPDVCGIASQAVVPLPPADYPEGWESQSGATSFATAQVAGIAALLLQKSPTLTPEEVRNHLTATATDVKSGTTASDHTAKKGRDLATGFGLANALAAWNSIP